MFGVKVKAADPQGWRQPESLDGEVYTSSLTQGGVLLAAILAGERRIPILIAYALWAILFHTVGFVDNNIEDYEHDRKDPAKKHFLPSDWRSNA